MTYKYSADWFSWAPDLLTAITPMLPERKRILEIGAFEGRSTVWMLEHMLEDDGELYTVDTWGGGEEHAQLNVDMTATEANFDYNMLLARTQFPDRHVAKLKGLSRVILSRLVDDKPFDFIYVDGSHTAPDVLTDACMAWGLLKPGGFMVFDDYLWGDSRDILHRPKAAVDAFVNIFAEQCDVRHMNYQLAVMKKVPNAPDV